MTDARATETPLKHYVGDDWPLGDDVKLRRIGWLDQKGRVWVDVSYSEYLENFDGGSLTPLLIPLDD